MATDVVQPNWIRRTITFTQDVMAEMKKVTWPDWTQVRQLSIGVIALSLLIGGAIALMDLVFQNVLVTWIPSLFRG